MSKQIHITIEMDNDAFEIDTPGELREIFAQITDRVEAIDYLVKREHFAVRDSNGNAVGRVVLVDDDAA